MRRREGRVPPLLALLLRLYPRSFRTRFGPAMGETFAEELTDAGACGRGAVVAVWVRAVLSLPLLALEEHGRAGSTRVRGLFRRMVAGSRGAGMIDSWTKDIRLAFRAIARAPSFAAVTVVTVGLGVGATTAVYSLTNALLFRPLPVAAPQQLLRVQEERTGRVSTGMEGMRLPYARYEAYEEATRDVFSGLAASNLRYLSMRTEGPAFSVAGVLVSGNFFDVLGVHPAAGRFFARADEPAVVLGYRLWQQRFGGSVDAIGQPVHLNGHVMTVVGVAAREFGGTVGFLSADLWVPHGAHAGAAWEGAWVTPFGRLRPGVDRTRASVVVHAAALRIPPEDAGTEIRGAHLEAMTGMPTVMAPVVGGFLGILLATAFLVLLIAGANVAGMLLARAVARRQEVAVQCALGAGRGRLVRQSLTETVALFLLGGFVGLFITLLATRLLTQLRLPISEPVLINAAPDMRVVAFGLGTAVLTGVLFGLMPALQASRPALVPALKEGGRTASKRGTRTRGVFVAAQLAMSVLLLIGATLCVRTLQRALSADPGFTADGVVVATTNLAPHGYDEERGRVFYDQLIERVRATPGVEAAALARLALLTGDAEGHTGWRLDTDDAPIHALQNVVDAAYFGTMRVDIVAGRGFDQGDIAGAPPVVVVNEVFARRLWSDENPIGKTVLRSDTGYLVVGVARDGKYTHFGEGSTPFVFLPAAQHYAAKQVLHVRMRADMTPPEVIAAVRNATADLDVDVAVERAAPLIDAVGLMLFPQRFAALLIGVFGLLGLVLAGLGVYGILAHDVAQRSHEFGIRLALGADARILLRLVVGRGVLLTATGGLAGLVSAALFTRFLHGLLYGVSPLDPLTFFGVPLVLGAVGLVASYVPARRALRVDPIHALRAD